MKNEIYVDYALRGKVGIYSDSPFLRVSFIPTEKIDWQIEGEALAILSGVKYFLKEKKEENKKLVIYTDSRTLLRPFRSKTQAGKWWFGAKSLAQKSNCELEIKFVSGKKNPADCLTRSRECIQKTREKKTYFYQQWLSKVE